MELLIGCGSRREKCVIPAGVSPHWTKLVTLDFNGDHNPDVVWDLTKRPFPFEDSTFDEVHAYEVLEHLGQQGDFRSFFDDFSELWRILKPGGWLIGTSPAWNSKWAWGDPGHTRIISAESLLFLDQSEYAVQVGKTPMSDYRWCYKADFEPRHGQVDEPSGTFCYALQAVKPSRIA
jgi:SAM-dependent methyltransferase